MRSCLFASLYFLLMSAYLAASSIARLTQANSCLFICDIQTRFRPLIYRSETLIRKCNLLLKGAYALNMPVVISEQYVKAFGSTVPELQIPPPDGVPSPLLYEKRQFSMRTEEVQKFLVDKNIRQVLFMRTYLSLF